jgi:CRISPR system Cascade subunit CasD
VNTLLLRLAAPLQSWGTLDRFGLRSTDTEPSKSGVVGLLCAAMGIPRGDATTIAELGRLAMGVRVDREGEMLRDYHTTGGGSFAGRPHGVYDAKLKRAEHTVPTERFYLADASFLVALHGEAKLIERARDGLLAPVWPIFLGRKACPPAGPVFVGIVDDRSSLEECLRVWARDDDAPNGPLRLVLESGPEGRARDDVPLSFDPRRFGRRYVVASQADPPRARRAS